MSRPEHTNPIGAKFSINVPPGWHAITTGISRKVYDQGLEVAYDIVTPDSRIFGATPGSINEQMKSTIDQSTSLPMISQEDEYRLDYTFYYSTKAVKDAEELADKQAFSSKIHVVKAAKRPGSYDGPDSVTFFVFVEDTPSQEAGTGQFDDAVTTIHFVEK
ncbi:hypothetical protein Hypma_008898 [Hypsizygus marmoreus]|uniref:Uncharacterized protein n=1 Tax=Hypsizygus marmoreus TaxID=39966 RepID=A0A369JRQ0_HYPMA|nr:hypothetical protein Hypma_008898 [Hypsizygus marmoreus]